MILLRLSDSSHAMQMIFWYFIKNASIMNKNISKDVCKDIIKIYKKSSKYYWARIKK